MVGMAAVLAGAVHAPLTAIILLFEMTSNYRIILPVMFAVVVSLLLSQRLQRDSVYGLGLARKGVRIQRGRDVEVLEAMTVGEVMQTNSPTLHEQDTLGKALDRLQELRRHGLPVLNQAGELAGIITLQDIDRIQPEELEAAKTRRVSDIATRDLLVAYPDETLGAALQRMSVRDIGNLPVVARDQTRQLLGVLRRADLVRAYNVALARRAAIRHRAQQVRLDAFSGANVEEVIIKAGAASEGQFIREVAWPRDCIIASIRRGQQTLIPHGDTVLKTGDVLVAVAEGEARQTLRELCQSPKTE
jgi:CIC family chloride channel protein